MLYLVIRFFYEHMHYRINSYTFLRNILILYLILPFHYRVLCIILLGVKAVKVVSRFALRPIRHMIVQKTGRIFAFSDARASGAYLRSF